MEDPEFGKSDYPTKIANLYIFFIAVKKKKKGLLRFLPQEFFNLSLLEILEKLQKRDSYLSRM